MSEPKTPLKGDEITCVKKLAERFEQGKFTWSINEGVECLGLTNENFKPVLALFEDLHIIESATGQRGTAMTFRMFNVNARAVVIARSIEAEQTTRPDVVDELKTTARSSRPLAYAIIAFLVFAAFMNVISSCSTIAKNSGWIKGNQALPE